MESIKIDTLSPSSNPSDIWVEISPRSKAPQPFKTMRELIGAEVESQTKASLAWGILYFWQNGFPTAPEISEVIDGD